MPLIRHADAVTAEWLSGVLGEEVTGFEITTAESNWAKSASIRIQLASGSERNLWLKMCAGETFGRSEVDYYTHDYVDLPEAPLLPCYDAIYERGGGYHLLLEDVSATHEDRRTAPPTLEHGLALAEAMARLHRHHWERGNPHSESLLRREIDHVRLGLAAFERETGRHLADWFETHADRIVARWQKPQGLTLLHGDLNPTNVLAPRSGEGPIYLIDRQPFEWSPTYGLAVFDLAYALCPWWPLAFRRMHEEAILRHWFDTVAAPDYGWDQCLDDWELSVEQCLYVPIEWCCIPEDVDRMRWLWFWQLENLLGRAG